MKLLRVGPLGKEKVCALDNQSKIRDLSSYVNDLDPDTLTLSNLSSWAKIDLEKLPEINNSLHDFRWDNALAVGKKIFKKEFPEDVTVYLIQVKDLSFGLEISSILQPAVKKVTEHIEEEIRRFVFKQKNKTINK